MGVVVWIGLVVWFGAVSSFIPKHEYVYSIKKDVIMTADKSGINFFNSKGDVLVNDQTIRLVPSMESKKGLIHSKRKTFFEWWEVVIDAHIMGSNSIGADGMAFWFVREPPTLGNALGANDRWNGLGVMFDTFNNDNQGPNPQIVAIINNNTFIYDHDNDGRNQVSAGCQIDFRNTPFRVRLRYFENKLTMWFKSLDEKQLNDEVKPPNLGATTMDPTYGYICFNKDSVYLPREGYFALSAMTGDFGDDHDLHGMAVFSIRPGTDKTSMLTTEEDRLLESEKSKYDQLIKDREERYAQRKPSTAREKLFAEDHYSQALHIIKSQQNMLLSKFDNFDSKINQFISHAHQLSQSQVTTQQKSLNQLKEKISESLETTYKEFSFIRSLLDQTTNQLKVIENNSGHNGSVCLSTNFFCVVMIIQLVVMVGFIVVQSRIINRVKKLY